MRTDRKKYKLFDWRLTMAEIGRGFQKLYPAPQKLPPRLRAALARLEHTTTKSTDSRRRSQQQRKR
jgi:hypothetical protein